MTDEQVDDLVGEVNALSEMADAFNAKWRPSFTEATWLALTDDQREKLNAAADRLEASFEQLQK